MTGRDLRIAKTLITVGRQEPVDWGYNVTRRKDANKFLFTCSMDYQMNGDTVWQNANWFIVSVLGDPKDLWATVREWSESKWWALCQKNSLHRFPQAWERIWRIAGEVEAQYKGDARRIWRSADGPVGVIESLESIGFGPQLSRMTAGALKDQGQISGSSVVKADLHVRRVVGRIMNGESVSAQRATELTKRLYPRDPWQLDRGLFLLGKTTCRPTPVCTECLMNRECTFSRSQQKTA